MIKLRKTRKDILKCCNEKTRALFIGVFASDKDPYTGPKRINKRICLKCERVYND